MIKESYIRCWKSKGKYTCRVYSEKGKNMGTYTSKSSKRARQKAKNRLKDVEYFKRNGDKKALQLIKLAQHYEQVYEYREADRLNKYITLLRREASFFDLPQAKKPKYTKTRKKYTKPPKEISKEVRVLETRIDPRIMANALYEVVRFVLAKVPENQRIKRRMRLKEKIMQLNPNILSTKHLPEASAIGQSLTIIKNMMFGKSQTYISEVLRELIKRLS